MEAIRILHIVPNMQAGGLESFIMNIYRNIDRNKVQFDFLYHYKGDYFFDDEIKKMGGRIYNLTVRQDNNILKYKRDLLNFFKGHKEYKVVHSHMPSLGFLHLKVAQNNGVKVRLLHSHTSSFEKSLKGYTTFLLSRFSVKYSSHRLACSLNAGKYLFKNNDFKVINNAIDSKRFIFDINIRENIRKKLDISDKFVVGHIGRFVPTKNHLFLIDIFYEILREKENAILLLIGDGNVKSDIEYEVKKLGIEKNIIFYGVSDKVEDLLQAMDIFILPSLFEGLGMVLIEAQSSGLKCFTSSGVVPNEAKISDNIEYISLNENPTFWAKNILKYYDGYERKNMLQNVYINNYDINKISNDMEKFYISNHNL